jgi:histidinol-phosphate/aromatic aminotransferase/cobyric acid decarboxylase-like protein/choline kinase
MQAIILAAGMGNRLGKHTKHNTKCMVSINGRTLIERSLDALSAAGITKCVIVVGYQKQNLMDFVGNRYKDIAIEYVSNDVYNKTNNIYSLYLAKDHLLRDDTLLLESDLLFDESLISDMLKTDCPALAAVAPYESWMDGTVVQLAENNVISAFIPKKFFNYGDKKSYYKTVNIYKFSREFLQNVYVPFLGAYSEAMGNNEYYEQVLRVIAALDKHEIKAFILTNQKWYEIDDVQDKNIAETIFSNTSADRLKRMQKSYGGYWRYPRLLDYCYLVNPYFPTSRMFNELNDAFPTLIASYPSGLDVQNLLQAKLFNIEEANILTGNGAAELIRALSPSLSGTVGLIYPTFNEYEESLCGNEVVTFIPANFNYTKTDVEKLAAKCNNIILINPDNPSGNYIPSKDIIEIAARLKSDNKMFILDESFVDFSGEENASLFKQEILDMYPNLVVIKSLSKSYGIPGIRLGALASGNRELIKKVRERLSIWNINSFGEYFLQIIGKYTGDYAAACKALAVERERFKKLLEKTGILKVYPSGANYFLCRIIGNKTAPQLTEELLEKHDVFIKDLTGKKGIPDASYVRIAIRSSSENDKLASVLASG